VALGGTDEDDIMRNYYQPNKWPGVSGSWDRNVPNPRGFFGIRNCTDPADGNYSPYGVGTHTMNEVTDGLSNSIALSERVGVPGPSELYNASWQRFPNPKMGTLSSEAAPWLQGIRSTVDATTCPTRAQIYALMANPDGPAPHFSAGLCWTFGSVHVNGLSTVMPPNTASCSGSMDARNRGHHTVNTPSSNHTGGVSCAFGDGSVHFISENINDISNMVDPDGNGTDVVTNESVILLNAAPWQTEMSGRSKWGVWGSLGAINDGQAVSIP
jgi:hypothetical protein